ncbi:hypothetical protein OH77DRAFT_195614 [Trametes cingulata]|nr:hypothetical protein OH77DRAFT_195614 [Trametes cingulata]
MKLWKEIDDEVLKLPKEKRAAWLTERLERVEVIGNRSVEDIVDMALDLLQPHGPHRDWLRRVEELLAGVNGHRQKPSALHPALRLTCPML